MRRTLTRAALARLPAATAVAATVLAATVLAATAATALASVPVAAADSPHGLSKCPPNSLCGWSGPRFEGSLTTFRAGGGCQKAPFPLQSIANSHPGGIGIDVILSAYAGPDCTGAYLGTAYRGDYLPFLPQPALSVHSAW
ncbi:hypothetical protein [Actinomadura roseirufa]|uniref:hypothetical protein n=1 Tax=Actinomadura roseirufa TaxID=2094049 RepID=UPI0010410579|nr:hypothetical protein [Actinomadura roseirufa]